MKQLKSALVMLGDATAHPSSFRGDEHVNGNGKLGFLQPESSWVWLCSPCRGTGLEHWGPLLQMQRPGTPGTPGPLTEGCSPRALAPGRALPAPGLLLLPRMLQQGCGFGLSTLCLPTARQGSELPLLCSHPGQGCPCPAGAGHVSGAGHRLRADAAVGPVCPSVQERRILSARVALKGPG